MSKNQYPTKEYEEKHNDPMSVKTLLVMELLAMNAKGMGITDISRETGLNKSTVYRIVAALHTKDYVLKDEKTRQYRLGLKVLQLSNAIIDSLELRDIANPEMISLATDSRETVHLISLDGDEGVYIDKIDTTESIGLLSRIGKRLGLYSTASGKVMLAFSDAEFLQEYLRSTYLTPMTPTTIVDNQQLMFHLDEIRRRGYALDREENRVGIICVAAPILQSGKPIAAISVSGPSFRFTSEAAERLAPKLMAACSRISRKLG